MPTDFAAAGAAAGPPARVADGLVAVVKSSCETCQEVAPVLADLAERVGLVVYTQEGPTFPADADWVIDDTDLSASWHLDLEAVPTLLRITGGTEVERVEGWDRDRWEETAGVDGLGPDLPPFKPG